MAKNKHSAGHGRNTDREQTRRGNPETYRQTQKAGFADKRTQAIRSGNVTAERQATEEAWIAGDIELISEPRDDALLDRHEDLLDLEQVDGMDSGENLDDVEDWLHLPLPEDPESEIPEFSSIEKAPSVYPPPRSRLLSIHAGRIGYTLSSRDARRRYSTGTSLGKIQLNQKIQRLDFYQAFCDWTEQNRPRFLATFSLWDWAPATAEAVELAIRRDNKGNNEVNCLQASMARLLSLQKDALSRWDKETFIGYEGRHYMLLADLFSQTAKTIWAAAALIRLCKAYEWSKTDLSDASDKLVEKGVRTNTSLDNPDVLRPLNLIRYVCTPFPPGGKAAISTRAVAAYAISHFEEID